MFFSPTCPYCRTLDPYFRGFLTEFFGLATFGRLDIMASSWIAERHGILSTPTFVVFCIGRPFQQLVGGVYPALLKRMVEESISQWKECMKSSTTISYDISGYG